MAQLAPFGHGPRPFSGRVALNEIASSFLPAFNSEEGRARYLAAYDAVLADWPVAYEEIDVPTRLGSTHVVASGPKDARPLILLPSFAGTATVWRLNAAGLNGGFRTYAIDVIGQPGKSLAVRRLASRRDYADWMVDLLDGLGLVHASLVGCSFGGFIALNQAAITPERVERVVAISPVGVFGSQYWRLMYAMRIRAPITWLVRRLRGRKRAPSMTDLVRRPPRDRKWAALMAVTMAERAEVSVINPPVFGRAELRAIRAPALLLIGAEETLYDPPATLKLAQARMPGLAGAIVPDADHIAAMAQPEDVNARIVEFLQAGRQASA
jgi:pimeloyl-ACP methyl ester carboxylesterase